MHGFYKNLRSKILLTRFALLLFHMAWTFFYHHVCKHTSVRNIWFLHWVSPSLFLVQHRWISRIPNPKFKKNFHFRWWNFFLHGQLFTNVKSHVVLLILKYWQDLFSLEVLKTERVTSPTDALGGCYIYRQPTIVVFRAGLYRQPLLKFFHDGSYW